MKPLHILLIVGGGIALYMITKKKKETTESATGLREKIRQRFQRAVDKGVKAALKKHGLPAGE